MDLSAIGCYIIVMGLLIVGVFSILFTEKTAKLATVCAFGVFALGVSAYPLEFADEGVSVIVLDQDKSFHSSAKWVDYCQNKRCLNFALKGAGDSTSWVSSGTKGRKLHYRVTVEITDQKTFINWLMSSNFKPEILPGEPLSARDSRQLLRHIIEYELIEFNNKHDAVLANIYNPHDQNQRSLLWLRLQQHVGPVLKKRGITLVKLSDLTVQ